MRLCCSVFRMRHPQALWPSSVLWARTPAIAPVLHSPVHPAAMLLVAHLPGLCSCLGEQPAAAHRDLPV